MIEAQSADGVIHQFPDGTDPSVVDRVMKTYATQAAPPKRSLGQDVTGFMANVNRGLGIGDEMAAGARTAGNLFAGKIGLGDVPSDFRQSMATQRQTEDSFASAHPHVAALAKGTGMAATAAVPAGNTANLFANSGRAVNAVRGATVAGLNAAGYAAVDRGSLSDRALGAARAARDPVTLGLGAAGGALATVPKAAKPRAPSTANAPSLEELTAQKSGSYEALDKAGVTYTPEATDRLISNVTADLKSASINPSRHPKAASMLSDIQAMSGQSPTLTELDQLRQVVRRDVARSKDEADAYMGRRIIQQIDEFVRTAKPADVAAGALPPDQAAQLLGRARDLNTRVSKIEAINDALAEARSRAGSTGVGGNIDNATRQELRKVAKRTGNLTPDEANAFDRAVRGSQLQNGLRALGRLSPEGGTVAAGVSLATGAASHGALPAAGFVARRISDAITSRNVDQLVRMIAAGAMSPEAQRADAELARLAATDPAVASLRSEVAARLSRAAGVAGGSQQASRNPFAQP